METKDYRLTDYSFRKVIIPVQFKNGSEAEYHLLIDQDNLIHYYQVIWSRVFIQQTTTKSHKESKKNQASYKFRVELLKFLKINHLFSKDDEKIKPESIELNLEQINIMNLKFREEWFEQTFQNIIYVLSGSNPSGEGKPKSAQVTTIYDNQKCALSFFLKCLNISNEKHASPQERKQLQTELNQQDCKRTITFDEWISKDYNLKRYFLIFNSYNKPNQWKADVVKMKEHWSKWKSEKKQINEKVQKKRNEFTKMCKAKYETIDDFWENGVCDNFLEYAHIKPVKKIREQIKEIDDDNLFNEISDPHNCIPLSPNIHTLYDKYNFYWNEAGILETKNSNLTEEINKYKTIPNHCLGYIKKYLCDYKKIYNEITNRHN